MAYEPMTLDRLYEERLMVKYHFKLLAQAQAQCKAMGYSSVEYYRNYDEHDLSEVYKHLCENLGCVNDEILELGGELF